MFVCCLFVAQRCFYALALGALLPPPSPKSSADLSAEVLRKTKKAVMVGLLDDLEPSLTVIEDIYLDELMETADANEGLKAFMEKRKPEWRNE